MCIHKKYLKNKIKIIKQVSENRKSKKEYYRQKTKERDFKNKDTLNKKRREYYKKTAERRREYYKFWIKSHRKSLTDLQKLKLRLRNLVMSGVKGKKSKHTEEILGISFEEFKLYIESKWEPWMNWKNYGTPIDSKIATDKQQSWDLDHIKPLSLAKNNEEVYILNHYTNFQPLCSYTNRWIKRNIYD